MFRADDAYYGQHLQREEEPAFQIAVYDMDLALGRELRAAVTMDLKGPALSAYPFTLYHGYQVTRVTDENGAALPFTREGDYLTVTPAGPSPPYRGVCRQQPHVLQRQPGGVPARVLPLLPLGGVPEDLLRRAGGTRRGCSPLSPGRTCRRASLR